jgi:hypothetical protein
MRAQSTQTATTKPIDSAESGPGARVGRAPRRLTSWSVCWPPAQVVIRRTRTVDLPNRRRAIEP